MYSSWGVSMEAIEIHSECDDKCCVWWSLKVALYWARHRCTYSAVPHLSQWFWNVRRGQLMPSFLWWLSKPVLFKLVQVASAMQIDSHPAKWLEKKNVIVLGQNFWRKWRKRGELTTLLTCSGFSAKTEIVHVNIFDPKVFYKNWAETRIQLWEF